MSILFNAPAVAVLDQNYNLTVSWTPFGDSLTGSYSAYNHWDVYTTVNAGPIHTAASPAPVGYAGGSLTFTEILSAGVVTQTIPRLSSPRGRLAAHLRRGHSRPWSLRRWSFSAPRPCFSVRLSRSR